MFNAKKKYFKAKLVGVRNMIWDREFKIFKLKELREDLRKEYDRQREVADSTDKVLKEKKDLKEEARKTLTEKWTNDTKVVASLQGKLDTLDNEIAGSGNPDGGPSVQAELDGLRELRGMIVEYMKRLG